MAQTNADPAAAAHKPEERYAAARKNAARISFVSLFLLFDTSTIITSG